jgi:hypothetical protein
MRALALLLLAAAAGCRGVPAGSGSDRARSLTLSGAVGFALDQNALETNGPTLFAFGLDASYYFVDCFALGLRYAAALDISGASRSADLHQFVLDAKLQGDVWSWKPYLHGGAGLLFVDAHAGSTSDLSAHWFAEGGAGLDYYFTENWAFTVDATVGYSDAKVVDVNDNYLFQALFGVKYKF